jgi:hypothetical protein
MDNVIKEKKYTTVALDKDVYSLILNKQNEIFNKIHRKMLIQDIASEAVKNGINLIKM